MGPARAGRSVRSVGRTLLDELLAGRTELYAVLSVNPAAEALRLYEQLGWRHVVSTSPGNSRGMDVMLLNLSTHVNP